MRLPRRPAQPGHPLAGQQRPHAPYPSIPGEGPFPGRPVSTPPPAPTGDQLGRSTRPRGGRSSG
eukprot:6099228-Alexandrium_andersonii.AAC.1